ncbi:hypothetical protein AJ79_05752 [Helicocarpus griseus UAMH5409]|uniref:Uncharacterized protein n=1 Tax=Helicocarpus griseus UAMH5409 TaxID=1447875 RepID=A0A2B7XKA4_9EURO|nr:hypothetical protein AJ79_05752 [Helicocarpus griseus UAMH5409]
MPVPVCKSAVSSSLWVIILPSPHAVLPPGSIAKFGHPEHNYAVGPPIQPHHRVRQPDADNIFEKSGFYKTDVASMGFEFDPVPKEN